MLPPGESKATWWGGVALRFGSQPRWAQSKRIFDFLNGRSVIICMDQLVSPTYLEKKCLEKKAETGLSASETGYYITAWLAPNGTLGLGPAMTQKLRDLKHELSFQAKKGGQLTPEERAVLDMGENELFERGATLMNEILLNKQKAAYQAAEFAKDIVGSARLVGVTNTGVGQQRLVARAAAPAAGAGSG